MKPVSWDKQLGLASPLETAASQSGKIKSPSNKEAGLDVSHHALVSREGRGENFFLDILFYRISALLIERQPEEPSGSVTVTATGLRFTEARLTLTASTRTE